MGGKIAAALALDFPSAVASLTMMDIAPVSYADDDACWAGVRQVVFGLAGVDMSSIRSKVEMHKKISSVASGGTMKNFIASSIVATRTPEDTRLGWKFDLDAIAASLGM
jgi:pimeloyl-ACP methyl ester carboxylesterase